MNSITQFFTESVLADYDAIVISSKGDPKYIFIKGKEPPGLIPDSKRYKNKMYIKNNRKIYPVIVDMFEHPFIKSKDNALADIWVVDNLEQAQKQLDLMIQSGAKQFSPKIKLGDRI